MKPPENAEDYRQCVACEYISSDERLYDPYTLFPCPSCKRKGIWSKDVDWSSPDRALDDLAAISQELGLDRGMSAMASDLMQKLDDIIKLHLESKADIEALGRKAVWMADRIAELEAALREMVLSVPGGSICDPQEVADTLRAIAERVGVAVE